MGGRTPTGVSRPWRVETSMTPERWRQVEQLYHRALDQEAESRGAFVAKECGEDEALLEEVRSLLVASHDDDYLEIPAMQVAAKIRARDEQRWDITGRTISHYRIGERLGGDVNARVYRAEDARLGRPVAITFLQFLAGDAEARERFRRDSRASAALNHPNIGMIFDIDDWDGVPFVVMELLEGTTLEHRLASGALPVDELLDLALQVADGLHAAHEQGLLHNHLSPANLFLTTTRQVKILGFGVGSPGSTTEYRSPEQVRGERLDGRTDLFSLGTVLRVAAKGVPLPAKLDDVISKASDKDRDVRYQHVADLRVDLRRLKREIDTLRSPQTTETNQPVRLGRYRITAKLGAGGMGTVYQALDPVIGRTVAIKTILQDRLGSPAETAQLGERLKREAQAAGNLNHPNIVTVFDAGEEGGVNYIVMELVHGSTLDETLPDSGTPMPTGRALEILAEAAAALDFAHSHHVVHRDVKPSNIMIQADGAVKLADFGIARRVTTMDTTMTTGVIGSPLFMSPEQLRGQEATPRSDQYSLAVVAWILLAGSKPFGGDELLALISNILTEQPAPSDRLDPARDRVLRRALAKEPEARFESCGSFVAALSEACAGKQGVDAESVTAKRPKAMAAREVHLLAWCVRRWKLGVLCFCLVAGILVVWRFRSRPVVSFATRDWVLVADFDNQTSDPVFDRSLPAAFSVSLEQSRYANVFPRSRIREVLARMKKDAGTKIDDTVAQEIAVREGIRALVLPSISGVGEDYRLAARIRDVASGTLVVTTVVKAHGKQRVLDSLDQLAAKVRGSLGEPQLATYRDSRPLPSVTTASLEALKQYAIGAEKRSEGLSLKDLKDSKLYFENALKIDPAFTAAKSSLGILNFEHFDREEGKRLLADAVRNADNLTDIEKYGLLSFHARVVEGNLEKAVGYDRILIGLHPDLVTGHNNLGVVYRDMGRYAEAIAEFKECLRINPRERPAFFNLVETYITGIGDLDSGIESCNTMIANLGKHSFPYCLRGFAYLAKGKLEEAVSDLEQSLQLNPKGTLCQINLALAYQLSGKKQNAIKVLNDVIASDPRNCDAYYQMGLVHEAFQDGSAARRQWLRSVDCREAAVRSQANDAVDYLEMAIARTRLGDSARAQAAELKALSIDPKLYFDTARLRSVQGRTDEALTLLERAEKNGLHDFGWVKVNPDLRRLSPEPRFAALLQRNLKGL